MIPTDPPPRNPLWGGGGWTALEQLYLGLETRSWRAAGREKRGDGVGGGVGRVAERVLRDMGRFSCSCLLTRMGFWGWHNNEETTVLNILALATGVAGWGVVVVLNLRTTT